MAVTMRSGPMRMDFARVLLVSLVSNKAFGTVRLRDDVPGSRRRPGRDRHALRALAVAAGDDRARQAGPEDRVASEQRIRRQEEARRGLRRVASACDVGRRVRHEHRKSRARLGRRPERRHDEVPADQDRHRAGVVGLVALGDGERAVCLRDDEVVAARNGGGSVWLVVSVLWMDPPVRAGTARLPKSVSPASHTGRWRGSNWSSRAVPRLRRSRCASCP